jgi:hypothetical protein
MIEAARGDLVIRTVKAGAAAIVPREGVMHGDAMREIDLAESPATFAADLRPS